VSNTVELPVLKVRISTVEDARRAVFSSLDESGLSAAKQRTVANSITARLRRDGLLASSVDQRAFASVETLKEIAA